MPKIPPQNYKRYNRESGNKTLAFVGILIALIIIFVILSLILMAKPKILTSSITKQTPTQNTSTK